MKVPLLLIVWRRPNTLRKLIDAIRPLAPENLFVACDGPNPQRLGEAEQVYETRNVIEQLIDWPCHVERLYSDVNHGCRLGVILAISWFFNQVDEGIILEDDCIPSPAFFGYCQELLSYYRHDTRIMSICGSNFQNGQKRGDGSYYFSIYSDPWGWATWRRAWQHFHISPLDWKKFVELEGLRLLFQDNKESEWWETLLNNFFYNNIPDDAWDFQWMASSWMQHGLHVWPNAQLVKNIGFGEGATHTFGTNPFSGMSLPGPFPLSLSHPSLTIPCIEADQYAFKNRFVQQVIQHTPSTISLAERAIRLASIVKTKARVRALQAISSVPKALRHR